VVSSWIHTLPAHLVVCSFPKNIDRRRPDIVYIGSTKRIRPIAFIQLLLRKWERIGSRGRLANFIYFEDKPDKAYLFFSSE
jgi:hypothetical protein